MLLLEQELVTLTEHLGSLTVIGGVCFVRCLVVWVAFCRSLFFYFLFLLAIVSSVFLLVTGYPFNIFKLFLIRIFIQYILSWRCVQDTTLCDKVCQLLATCQWFSPVVTVSATNYTYIHDRPEIFESDVKHQTVFYFYPLYMCAYRKA